MVPVMNRDQKNVTLRQTKIPLFLSKLTLTDMPHMLVQKKSGITKCTVTDTVLERGSHKNTLLVNEHLEGLAHLHAFAVKVFSFAILVGLTDGRHDVSMVGFNVILHSLGRQVLKSRAQTLDVILDSFAFNFCWSHCVKCCLQTPNSISKLLGLELLRRCDQIGSHRLTTHLALGQGLGVVREDTFEEATCKLGVSS